MSLHRFSGLHPSQPNAFLKSTIAILLAAFAATLSAQQDYILPNVPYICNGERLVIENCNVRDTSDTSTCMVGHPDHVMANGLMQYTSMTRAAIKQLFPTCKQPTPDQVARAKAFHRRQQDLYDANVKKANNENDAIEARARALPGQKPLKPEERAISRCITSGRLPSSCTGNALLGAFGQMLSSVLPSAGEKEAQAGPTIAGVYEGAGRWRLDFIDGGVLVNCSFLSPNQEAYTLNLTGARPILTINIRPRPLVLTLRADGTIAGPGPVTIVGVVAGGYTAGTSTPGHNETSTYTTTERMNANSPRPATQQILTQAAVSMTPARPTRIRTMSRAVLLPAIPISFPGLPPAPPPFCKAPVPPVSKRCRPICSKACSGERKVRQRLPVSGCTVSTRPPPASAFSSSQSLRSLAAAPTQPAHIPTPCSQKDRVQW